MADILAFRTSTPTIYIDGADEGLIRGWYVNVRPCPPSHPPLEKFESSAEVLNRALTLNREHGWTIQIASDCPLDGAA